MILAILASFPVIGASSRCVASNRAPHIRRRRILGLLPSRLQSRLTSRRMPRAGFLLSTVSRPHITVSTCWRPPSSIR